MLRFPFLGFPYQYPYYMFNKNYNNSKNIDNNSPENSEKSTKNKKSFEYRQPFYFNFDALSDNTKPVIEILGINLYLDDIMILCLLFLLYKEEVKDEMLFICLLLLLLS